MQSTAHRPVAPQIAALSPKAEKALGSLETWAAHVLNDRQIREAAAWETATDGNWVPFVAPTPTHRRNWVPAAQTAGNDHYWDDVIDGYSYAGSAA